VSAPTLFDVVTVLITALWAHIDAEARS